jgi:hypothetical protein
MQCTWIFMVEKIKIRGRKPSTTAVPKFSSESSSRSLHKGPTTWNLQILKAPRQIYGTADVPKLWS